MHIHDDERLPDPMMAGVEEDESEVGVEDDVGALTPASPRDTPMHRVTIDIMQLDELDQLLSDLRQRRLLRVEAVRARATMRAQAQDEVERVKFDKLLTRVTKMLDKAQADEEKIAVELNKLRIMATALGG